MEKIILCRKLVGEVPLEEQIKDGFYNPAPDKFCCKPIAKANALNFCPEHYSFMPLWPVEDGFELSARKGEK